MVTRAIVPVKARAFSYDSEASNNAHKVSSFSRNPRKVFSTPNMVRRDPSIAPNMVRRDPSITPNSYIGPKSLTVEAIVHGGLKRTIIGLLCSMLIFYFTFFTKKKNDYIKKL